MSEVLNLLEVKGRILGTCILTELYQKYMAFGMLIIYGRARNVQFLSNKAHGWHMYFRNADILGENLHLNKILRQLTYMNV
jgi:hypothetical protein